MSDIWSYRILLYDMITFGSFPYQGLSNSQVLSHVKYGKTLPIHSCQFWQVQKVILSCQEPGVRDLAVFTLLQSAPWQVKNPEITNSPAVWQLLMTFIPILLLSLMNILPCKILMTQYSILVHAHDDGLLEDLKQLSHEPFLGNYILHVMLDHTAHSGSILISMGHPS